jgi:hypothetical protein
VVVSTVGLLLSVAVFLAIAVAVQLTSSGRCSSAGNGPS